MRNLRLTRARALIRGLGLVGLASTALSACGGHARRVVVPEVYRNGITNAVGELRNLGFKVQAQVLDDRPDCFIRQQHPAPGTPATRGSVVRLDIQCSETPKAVCAKAGVPNARPSSTLVVFGRGTVSIKQACQQFGIPDRVIRRSVSRVDLVYGKNTLHGIQGP